MTGTWLVIVGLVGSLITIFFGFLHYTERLLSAKARWVQTAAALGCLVLFVGLAFMIGKGKVFVNRQDLMALREIADGANKRADYDTTIKLLSWTMQFGPPDEELYRMRARAYKHEGYYQEEIEDRKAVLRLNPTRQVNELPIIEDYILLKQYQTAQTWISEREKTITDHDVRTMFEFFAIVCQILSGEEHTSAVKTFQMAVASHPLTRGFVTNFWKPQYLIVFLDQNMFPESSRATIKDLMKLLSDTAK